jgi:hypothetical protein
MSGWVEWAANLELLSSVYQRPANPRGMVTDAELCLAETYARYSYTGEGKIVELGCWLGAITLALARGVSENPQRRVSRPIEAFDRFRWEPWMTPVADLLGCPKVPDGESFFGHTTANVKTYEHLIRLHEQDLLAPHRFRDRIEFLFIDAMKSWELANAITQTYFPRLIAGRSLVVQQDFAHYDPVVATNHILMWSIRDRALPVYHVPNSCSVVFFVHQPFNRRDLPSLRPEEVTIEVAEQAWTYSMDFVGGEPLRNVWLCKVLFYVDQVWLDAALKQAERLVSATGRVGDPAVRDVRHLFARKQAASTCDRDRMKLAELETLLCG